MESRRKRSKDKRKYERTRNKSSEKQSPLDMLSVEVNLLILSHLSVSDLTKLASTSKEWSLQVLQYLLSRNGMAMVNRQLDKANAVCIHLFCINDCNIFTATNLGLLFKSATLTFPLKDRLNILHNVFKKQNVLSLVANFSTIQCIFTFFGYFLHGFCNGWTTKEMIHGHRYLEAATNIKRTVELTLKARPGVLSDCELYVRRYYRFLYLDPLAETRALLLANILEPYSFFRRAKLLYLLYGPFELNNHVDWCLPLMNLSPYSASNLNPVAKALRSLHENSSWKKDQVQTIILELSVLPTPWHPLNVCHLIVSCGPEVMIAYMSNFLLNGQYHDLGHFTIQCANLNLRHAAEVDSTVRILWQVMNLNDSYFDIVTFGRIFHDILQKFTSRGMDDSIGLDVLSLHKTANSIVRVIAEEAAHAQVYKLKSQTTVFF